MESDDALELKKELISEVLPERVEMIKNGLLI